MGPHDRESEPKRRDGSRTPHHLPEGTKMNLEKFLKRTRTRQKDLAATLGISEGQLSAMKKGRSDTSQEVCRRLLLAGMTVEELFGADVWEVVRRQALLEAGKLELSDEICRDIVERGLSALGKRRA